MSERRKGGGDQHRPHEGFAVAVGTDVPWGGVELRRGLERADRGLYHDSRQLRGYSCTRTRPTHRPHLLLLPFRPGGRAFGVLDYFRRTSLNGTESPPGATPHCLQLYISQDNYLCSRQRIYGQQTRGEASATPTEAAPLGEKAAWRRPSCAWWRAAMVGSRVRGDEFRVATSGISRGERGLMA